MDMDMDKPWRASTSTAKLNIHTKKVLLCIWWDMKGVFYYELLEPGQTITAQCYGDQLNCLSEKIDEKRLFSGHETCKVILCMSMLSHTLLLQLRKLS